MNVPKLLLTLINNVPYTPLGERIVGNVELYSDNGIVKFDDFKVHEDFRCRGFGKKIQHLAISRASEKGAHHIYAITHDNEFVKESYKKDGFVEVGILNTFRQQAADLVSLSTHSP